MLFNIFCCTFFSMSDLVCMKFMFVLGALLRLVLRKVSLILFIDIFLSGQSSE